MIEESEIGEHVNAELIKALLVEKFTGEIEQVPSMFSALKYKGQPLYKLARKGEKVEVKSRRVTILEISLLDYRPELGEFDLDVRCTKGTYIRSIVEDLGLMLGCGAHVSVLRRLESGPYKADMMITMDDINALAQNRDQEEDEQRNQRIDELILPSYSPVAHLPKISLDEQQKLALFQGKPTQLKASDEGLVRIHLNADDKFLGIGEVNSLGVMRSKRLLSTAE